MTVFYDLRSLASPNFDSATLQGQLVLSCVCWCETSSNVAGSSRFDDSGTQHFCVRLLRMDLFSQKLSALAKVKAYEARPDFEKVSSREGSF